MKETLSGNVQRRLKAPPCLFCAVAASVDSFEVVELAVPENDLFDGADVSQVSLHTLDAEDGILAAQKFRNLHKKSGNGAFSREMRPRGNGN